MSVETESVAVVTLPTVSFDQAADELYALPPACFVAARARLAAAARRGGDVVTATRITSLPKPSAAAWLVNQFARYFRDEVTSLLEIGRALSDATHASDGDRLRILTDRRRWAHAELESRAKWLAIEDRVPINRSVLRAVAQTLHSAMCNEEMAELLLAGRLARPLPAIGWPGLDSATDATESTEVVPIARARAEKASLVVVNAGEAMDDEAMDGEATDGEAMDGETANGEDRMAIVIPLFGRRRRPAGRRPGGDES